MTRGLFKSTQRCVLTAALAAPLLILPTATLAEDDEPTPGIETIQVNAQRREQNVQDVSFSIQAFNEATLKKAGIYDVSRLEYMVPGVTFAYAGNDAKINVRGANSSNTFADNSSVVGAFVDGVYKPRASQQTRAFFDVKRLEFLKGPQGTLYGRNTFAGAINLYTNTPDLEEFAAGIDGSYERFNRTRLEGFVNLPVTETFGLRIAGFFDKSDGFVENSAGPDIGAPNDRGIRLTALFEPTDAVEILGRYQYIRETGREAGLFGYTRLCRNVTPSGHTDPFGSVEDCANPQPGSGGLAAKDGPYNISQDFVPRAEMDEHVFTLDGTWDLGMVDIRSITSYTAYDNNLGFDFDFSPNAFQAGGFNEKANSTTTEIQVNFEPDSESWFIPQVSSGLYYSHDETNYQFYIYNQRAADGRGPDVPVLDNNGMPVLDDMGMPLVLPVLIGTPLTNNELAFGGTFADNQPLVTDYLGLYSQAEFSIMDDLRLIGGLRWNWENKELIGGGSNFTGDTNGNGMAEPPVTVRTPNPPTNGVFPTDAGDVLNVFAFNNSAADAVRADPDASKNVSWRAGVEWHGLELASLDSSMLYFTASTGFLSGALNNNGTTTEDQESRVLEWGIKSKMLENKVLFNLAAHYTTYTNLLAQRQVEQIVAGNTIVITKSTNGGEIKAWGIELESVWAPTPEAQLGFLFAYLNSEYETFGQSNPYQLFNGEVVGFVDFAGEQTPWSPKFTVTLYGSYLCDLGKYGWLTPYVQFYYSDDYNTSNLFGIDPLMQQESYTKTDLRLIWDSPSYAYSAEAFVENVENNAVLARGNNNGNDVVQHSYLYPRNFGLRFSANF